MKTCESVLYQNHIKYSHCFTPLCFSRGNTVSNSIKQLTKCWIFWSWSSKLGSTCFTLSVLWSYWFQQYWALLLQKSAPSKSGHSFSQHNPENKKKKIKDNFYTIWNQMEVTFFQFQMSYFSFIEIATLKNEVSLFENIRNNLVNLKKTLNSKFARCCSILQKSFLYLSMSI